MTGRQNFRHFFKTMSLVEMLGHDRLRDESCVVIWINGYKIGGYEFRVL